MELFLNIIQTAVLIVMGAALWQAWQILKKGRSDETLSGKDVDAFTRRLTVCQICLGIEAVATVCRIFLPSIFK